jgi:hypothetical protein
VKRASLVREESTDEGTFGTLRLEGGPVLRTTELPWRDNRPTISCIPPGVYRCEIVQSPKYGRVYGVLDVPGRSHILIHAANWAGDRAKGLHSDLLGCIAPGDSVGMLQPPNGRMQRAVIGSKRALHDLMAWAGGEPFELTIR